MSEPERNRLQPKLKSIDASIDWTVSVDEARSRLLRNHYDAAILDDGLPDDGCRELLEFAHDNSVGLPFLICTGTVGDKGLFAESKRTFIADMLVRPYRGDLVERRVRAALETDRTRPMAGATLPSHPLETGRRR